ncbi:MAG: hypothetical protein OJF49_003029 [Ktedonobacterales bacterium]|jgi:antitoxin (DNA-binding transcriptional repressor) of toxin-antitoxin stability system|nr:MAG: hypothetical protein OJF49_003029 [Ktedonobacterales bacterium]
MDLVHQVTPDEAKDQLNDLINAALRGETVLIAQDSEHKVQLVPIIHMQRNRAAGSGKGIFTMSDNFDAPLPDFEEYLR